MRTLHHTTIAIVASFALTACPENKPAATTPQPAKPASAPSSAVDQDQGKGTSAETRDQVDPDGVLRRGVKLSEAKAMTISEVVANADKLAGNSVKLTGKIDSVCERMGCWFVMKGEKPEESVRITAKDHAFYVPKTALGKTATVEGPFEMKTVDVGMAQHMEDEKHTASNEPKKKIEAPVRELSITAAAVEMKMGG